MYETNPRNVPQPPIFNNSCLQGLLGPVPTLNGPFLRYSNAPVMPNYHGRVVPDVIPCFNPTIGQHQNYPIFPQIPSSNITYGQYSNAPFLQNFHGQQYPNVSISPPLQSSNVTMGQYYDAPYLQNHRSQMNSYAPQMPFIPIWPTFNSPYSFSSNSSFNTVSNQQVPISLHYPVNSQPFFGSPIQQVDYHVYPERVAHCDVPVSPSKSPSRQNRMRVTQPIQVLRQQPILSRFVDNANLLVRNNSPDGNLSGTSTETDSNDRESTSKDDKIYAGISNELFCKNQSTTSEKTDCEMFNKVVFISEVSIILDENMTGTEEAHNNKNENVENKIQTTNYISSVSINLGSSTSGNSENDSEMSLTVGRCGEETISKNTSSILKDGDDEDVGNANLMTNTVVHTSNGMITSTCNLLLIDHSQISHQNRTLRYGTPVDDLNCNGRTIPDEETKVEESNVENNVEDTNVKKLGVLLISNHSITSTSQIMPIESCQSSAQNEESGSAPLMDNRKLVPENETKIGELIVGSVIVATTRACNTAEAETSRPSENLKKSIKKDKKKPSVLSPGPTSSAPAARKPKKAASKKKSKIRGGLTAEQKKAIDEEDKKALDEASEYNRKLVEEAESIQKRIEEYDRIELMEKYRSIRDERFATYIDDEHMLETTAITLCRIFINRRLKESSDSLHPLRDDEKKMYSEMTYTTKSQIKNLCFLCSTYKSDSMFRAYEEVFFEDYKTAMANEY